MKPLIIIIVLLLSGATSVRADVPEEPYMALRTGLKCSQCHLNRSGGGMRNSFGVIYSQTTLAIKPLKSESFFDGKLSRRMSVGANLRAENVSLFGYTSTQNETVDPITSSRIPEANLYLSFEMVPETFTIYLDQTMAPTGSNREFFGLIQTNKYNSYLKVGRMLLPYGLRLRDDEAFVRDKTGFTYSRHDLAMEVGIEPGPFSLIANVTDQNFSFVGQTVFKHFRVGGSFSSAIEGPIDYKYGAFAGFNFGKFSGAAEADLIWNGDFERFAAYSELYYLVRRGLFTKVSYEFFDRRRDVPNAYDGQERITFGVESFITPFMQFSVFYRMNRFIPQNAPLNQDQLLVQFHVFF